MNDVSISWVIPVYRSTITLTRLKDEIIRVSGENNWDFEIVYVIDCEEAETLSHALRLRAECPSVRVVELTKNFGQHNATLCGIGLSCKEFIVTLDDDLQHPPKEAVKLVHLLTSPKRIDVVYGYPRKSKHGLLRNVLSLTSRYTLQGNMGYIRPRQVSSYRAIRSEICRCINRGGYSVVNLDVMLSWITNKFGAVEVEYNYRVHGRSGYDLKKLLYHAIDMLTGYSIKPLRIASIVGIMASLFGFTMLAVVLFVWALGGGSVPGFTFLASIVLLLSGAELLALGIIGEYLARVHLKSLGKPAYLIRKEHE